MNTPWTVHGCGNPDHSAASTCWHVQDATGRRILQSVDRPTADRYASIPVVLERHRLAVAVVDSLRRDMDDNEEPTRVSFRTHDALSAYDAVKP